MRPRILIELLLCIVMCLVPCASWAATITSFSPAGGPPGTEVRIRGTGLLAVTQVQFNGIGAGFSVSSDTLILTNVPSTAASGFIRVLVGAVATSSPTTFFVGNPPVVSGASPQGGAVGQTTTITGGNFVGVTAVRFNGVPAVFEVNSTQQISAVVPAGARTGAVTVTNPAGTGSYSTFWLPPQIASVSPEGGIPGTPVTVTGINFSVVSSVRIGGVGCSYSISSDTRIVLTVPGTTSGPLEISSFAGVATAPFFVGAPPVVTSFDPPGGGVGTVVTLTGTGFTGTTSVRFGSLSAAFAVQSDTRMQVTVPTGAATSFIEVSNPAGSTTSSTPFYVGSPALVAGFQPNVAPVGATIEIQGSQFQGATEVRFAGGVLAPGFVVNNPSSITVTVPPLALSGPVTVRNPAGGSPSIATFSVSPSIVSFLPPAVPASSATGTPINITGYNLETVYEVAFNGVMATFERLDDRRLVAYVPPGATTGPISVRSALGSAVSALPFEVVQFAAPPRPLGVGWPHWPSVNVPVNGTRKSGDALVMAADSVGGCYLAWHEYGGSSGYSIRLQRLDAFGRRASGWPVNGVVVVDTVGNHTLPRVVADMVGGVYVVWRDDRNGSTDIFATRIQPNGERAPGWVSQGRVVTAAIGSQENPGVASDGAGGLLVAWEDYRNNNWDIFAQHLLSDGSRPSGWPANGLAVCTEGNSQNRAAIMVSDAAGGGVYVAWSDSRWGTVPALQRLLADGSVAFGWPANGVQVSGNRSYHQNFLMPGTDGRVLVGFFDSRPIVMAWQSDGSPSSAWPSSGRCLLPSYSHTGAYSDFLMVSDGAGGAFAVVQYYQYVFANHVESTGTIASGYGLDGVMVRNVVNNSNHLDRVVVSADGQGGAFVAWSDPRDGAFDIYASRLGSVVAPAPGWRTNGVPVSMVASSSQFSPSIVSDGRGGAVVAWRDDRVGSTADFFAQNLTGSSKLGNPEPQFESARDVAADQGGKVRLRWYGSYPDSLPFVEVSQYGVWRRITEEVWTARETALRSAPAKQVAVVADDVTGRLRVERDGVAITYWEGVGTVPARGQSLYSYVVSTLADSTAAGTADETYMVDAQAQFGPYFWSAGTITAHSVDNLPPQAPVGFTGSYSALGVGLRWRRNSERDLAGYRVHRGADAQFVPGPATMVAQVTDTMFTDPHPVPSYYKVEAVDINGNRSAVAIVVPPAVADVDGRGTVERLEFVPPQPNPARGSTMLHLRLPRSSRVQLRVHDAAGRVVRTMVDGVVASGDARWVWDLKDDAGKGVAAGLYFVRASDGREQRERRLVVIR